MTVDPANSGIYGGLYGSQEMRDLFSDISRLSAMLAVEAALARAEGRLGIIPRDAAEAIFKAAKSLKPDLAAMAKGAALTGQPVAALAQALGQAAGNNSRAYVHWGATTQDVTDTALVLLLRQALDLVARDLAALGNALAARAKKYRGLPMAGRTYMQQALPITFGFKCAIWLAPLADHLDRLAELKRRCLSVQFGGAAGTLASLGQKGRAVAKALAEELGLSLPEAPWHANRERLAEIGNFLALLCGSLGKFVGDVILLGQTEVGELSEPHVAGGGGSSTLPQKRNPVRSAHVLAAMRGVHALAPLMLTALAGDHERSAGAWQSEALALPQMMNLTSGALIHAGEIARGMIVDGARMRGNLDLTHGLILSEAVMMNLAEKTGRAEAQRLVTRACDRALEQRKPLAAILAKDKKIAAHLDAGSIARLTDPANYLGDAPKAAGRVVSRWRAAASKFENRRR
jgi:3-carboxy-cis,cis-muconate cycloisomerase